MKLGKVSSVIKGYDFYFKSSNFGDVLKYVLKPGSKRSRNVTKVLSTKGETIGHVVPDSMSQGTLAKYLLQKWQKLKLLDHQGMPLKENGYPTEG